MNIMKNNNKTKIGGIIGIVAVIAVIGLTIYAFVKDAKTEEHVEEITYSEFKDKVEGKNKSVILVGRNDCSHCVSYKPVITKVAEEYDFTVYYINTNNIKEESDFNALWDFLGANGTPTTAVVAEGKLVAMHEGEMTRSDLIAFLKANYF